jgi:hypothetical protein
MTVMLGSQEVPCVAPSVTISPHLSHGRATHPWKSPSNSFLLHFPDREGCGFWQRYVLTNGLLSVAEG